MTTPNQPGGVPDPSAYQPPSGAYPPPAGTPSGGMPVPPGAVPPPGGYQTPPGAYPGPGGYQTPPGAYPGSGGYQPPPGAYPPPPPPGGYPGPADGSLPPGMLPPGVPGTLPPGAPGAAPKKKNTRLIITLVVVAVVIVIGVTTALLNRKSDPANAKVGDCIHYGSQTNVKVVDCGSSDAQFRVVQRIDDTSDESACTDVADSDVSLYTTGSGKKYTLCVALVVKEGECVSSDGDVVPCTDGDAQLKVLKVLSGTTDKSQCPSDADYPRVYQSLNQVTCFQKVS